MTCTSGYCSSNVWQMAFPIPLFPPVTSTLLVVMVMVMQQIGGKMKRRMVKIGVLMEVGCVCTVRFYSVDLQLLIFLFEYLLLIALRMYAN